MDSVVPKDASSSSLCESGDRSEKTCRKLWEAIPQAYRVGHCYTDFWSAYQAVIPEEQKSVAQVKICSDSLVKTFMVSPLCLAL